MRKKELIGLIAVAVCVFFPISLFADNEKRNLPSSQEEETATKETCQQGHIYMGNKQYDEAIATFTKAIEISPTYTEAYTNRGIAYQNEGKLDKAISDYTKTIEIKPNVVAYTNRAIIYFDKGNHSQAISDCNKAIEIAPRSGSNAYAIRGTIYSLKGNFDQAIADFTKVIEFYPQDASTYYDRGCAYFNKKNYEKTWDDIQKAEKFGYKIDPRFLENLKKASGREK